MMIPLPVITPIVFSLSRSNLEYLRAVISGRLCSLSAVDSFGTFAERREASKLYDKLMQIAHSMDEYKVAEIELRLPVQSA